MIKIENLTKRYGKKLALDNVSIEIESGKIIALLGENGAGKTTLLRILANLLCKTSGSVEIDGLSAGTENERISYITGEGSYFISFTIGKYAEFLQDMHSAFDMQRYIKLCDFFELSLTDDISKLSTGQRARVELAAGFAKKVDYYFMDEPFLGKDVFTRRDFLKLMSGALQGTETIILCTHYIEEIENFIDAAAIIHKGKLEAFVSTDDMRAKGQSLLEVMAVATQYNSDKHIILD